MPQLTSSQLESFAHAVAAGHSATEAAKRAGYQPERQAHNYGSRYMKRQDVRERVEELRRVQDGPATNPASKSYIVAEVLETHRLARQDRNHAINLACMQFLAKLQGYMVDQRVSYGEKTTIHEVRGPLLSQALRAEIQKLPEAERAQILEAEPELLEAAIGGPAEEKPNE